MSLVKYVMMEYLENDLKFSVNKVHQRLRQGTQRINFMSPILTAKEEKAMTIPEIEASFNILVVVGKL
jgi:hypothetical protein